MCVEYGGRIFSKIPGYFQVKLYLSYGRAISVWKSKGEIDFLTKKIMPNIGVITNISYAHIKNFKNLKDIARAKSEIINKYSFLFPGSPFSNFWMILKTRLHAWLCFPFVWDVSMYHYI